GLGIATGDPIYVVGLNSEENEVLVGPREALKVQGLTLDEFNWLGDEAPQDGLPVLARVRSTRPPVAARLQEDDGGLTVIFDDGEEGVAPGQACVLYDLDKQGRVLGGGIIQKAIQRAWS
ncbi:MAG TPA: tRNA 2-thiouridine(34) synthase MnmA, partial [Alphaproteobacteria bacterium]|nr:tRNA 2-thiouridine(34) synthase MnmA [Alphaproteobacteria bacterium]